MNIDPKDLAGLIQPKNPAIETLQSRLRELTSGAERAFNYAKELSKERDSELERAQKYLKEATFVVEAIRKLGGEA